MLLIPALTPSPETLAVILHDMKQLLKLFLYTTLLLNCLKTTAQGHIPIGIDLHLIKPKMKEHSGFLVMKNGSDTLYGTIIFKKASDGQQGVMLKENKIAARFIATKQLSAIRLYDYDSLIVSTKFTDYKILNTQPKLWRLIASDKLQVYDELLYSNEKKGKIGTEIVIVENGTMYNLFRFWGWDTKSDLLKFVNNRYKTTFKRKDFTTIKELINYVVSKE